jgi:hypothetical protein
MWREIGKMFLELYEIHACENNVNLTSFSKLDAMPITAIPVYITYEGVKALSKIRPIISDNNLYMLVEIDIGSAMITHKHFVTELMTVNENSESEILFDEILTFNKENFINFLLDQKEFAKLKQYIKE